MPNTVNDSGNSTYSCAEAVPLKAREFERWASEHAIGDPWPSYLTALAHRASLTLKSMDQPAFAKSEVLQRESAKDLQAFAAAYAEWRK